MTRRGDVLVLSCFCDSFSSDNFELVMSCDERMKATCVWAQEADVRE